MRVCLVSGMQGGAQVGTWEREVLTDLARRARARRHQLVDDPARADVVLVTDVFFNHRLARVLTRSDLAPYRDRLYLYSEKALCYPVLPGLYTGLEAAAGDDRRYRTAAYAVHEATNPNRFLEEYVGSDERELLCSFVGRASHPIRRRVLALDFGGAPVHLEDSAAYDHWNRAQRDRDHHQRTYARTIARSAFVLCPRGWSPSTIRVYETMRLGRVPVIVADAWRPPYGPAWDDFAIFVAERDVTRIPAILAAHKDDAAARGQRARQAWQAHFAPDTAFDSLMDSLAALHARADRAPGLPRSWPLPWVAMSVHALGYHLGERARAFAARVTRS